LVPPFIDLSRLGVFFHDLFCIYAKLSVTHFAVIDEGDFDPVLFSLLDHAFAPGSGSFLLRIDFDGIDPVPILEAFSPGFLILGHGVNRILDEN
jgi:hypothetical protein